MSACDPTANGSETDPEDGGTHDESVDDEIESSDYYNHYNFYNNNNDKILIIIKNS